MFFTCSLLELMGRITHQKRKVVVNALGRKTVAHIYAHAETLHCEPIAKTADYFISFGNIPQGDFDNVTACKYNVPDYWTIGKVFARLIEDIRGDDLIEALFQVYNSPISDAISNYNSDFYYQPRDFLKEEYAEYQAETAT